MKDDEETKKREIVRVENVETEQLFKGLKQACQKKKSMKNKGQARCSWGGQRGHCANEAKTSSEECKFILVFHPPYAIIQHTGRQVKTKTTKNKRKDGKGGEPGTVAK